PVPTSHFVFRIQIGTVESASDTSTQPIGFGAKERKRFTAHVLSTELARDTGQECIALRPVGSEIISERFGCFTVMPHIIQNVVEIETIGNTALTVSPNPFKISISSFLLLFAGEASIESVTLYDSLGRIVIEKLTGPSKSVVLNVRNLALSN